MYILLAPIQLREGVDERTLLDASRRFQAEFVDKQHGIVKRILLRGKNGGYADLVFFASKEDADRVAEAEATSEHCLEFFRIMEPPDPSVPDMGVLSFEEVRTYESPKHPAEAPSRPRVAAADPPSVAHEDATEPVNARASGCRS